MEELKQVKKQKKKYKSGNNYLNDLKSVMDDVYNKNKHPILADYADAVAAKMTEDDIISFEKEHPNIDYNGPSYKGTNIHKTVKRKIMELVDSGDMIIEVKDNKTYIYPNNKRYKYYDFSRNLSKKVKFQKDGIHLISSNTFAVSIKQESNADELINLITGFIGEKHIYSISQLSNQLIIVMLCSFSENEMSECTKLISKAVKEAFIYQNPIEKIKPLSLFNSKESKKKYIEHRKIEKQSKQKTNALIEQPTEQTTNQNDNNCNKQ